jgi:hypothetical protein
MWKRWKEGSTFKGLEIISCILTVLEIIVELF